MRKGQSCVRQTGSSARAWVASVCHRYFPCPSCTSWQNPAPGSCQRQLCRKGTAQGTATQLGAWKGLNFLAERRLTFLLFPCSRELCWVIEQPWSVCSPKGVGDHALGLVEGFGAKHQNLGQESILSDIWVFPESSLVLTNVCWMAQCQTLWFMLLFPWREICSSMQLYYFILKSFKGF